MRRSKVDFDRDWLFYRGNIDIPYAVKAGGAGSLTDCEKGEEGLWQQIAFTDKNSGVSVAPDEWETVNLPHDWLVEEEFSKDGPLERGYKKSGVGCYRKMFDIPAADEGKKIIIEFDGVMRHSSVWVNGHFVGTHPSGSVPFFYDITDIVRYGDEGRNVIFVKVDARDYEGWWYDGAGIYRHVWLTTTDRLHVGQWGTYVTTPAVSEATSTVRIETTVNNEYRIAKDCELVIEIVDANGEVVASARSAATIPDGEIHTFVQQVEVSDPLLWSLEAPNLYKAIAMVIENGTETDRYETIFGIRTIEFTTDNGFFLNGKRTVIKGLCVHQDFAGVGVALPDSIIAYKLQLLQEMGANAYRSAHHPPTKELLEMCDRMGIMVIDENRRLDSSPEGIKNLKHMLYRDRNHPSIIAWSLENEEQLEGTVMGARILATLVQVTKKLDPTRPTTAALNHGFNDGGYSDELDIVGYNYGHKWGSFINDHAKHPERIIYGSEVSAYAVTRGIYEHDESKGYCSEYGTSWRENEWLNSWTTSPEQSWGAVAENPFLAGMFIWAGFDYRGEPSPFKWPNINSQYGTMDTCGFPKDNYYYYKSAWTDKPMIHLFPHWNWPGKEGQEIDVWAYSNLDTIELFLNGVSVGEQKRKPNGHVEWKVPYEPGKLLAVGRRDGEIVSEVTVETTGAAHHIRLMPHLSAVHANDTDAVAVRVAICDEQGRVVPTADNLVYFTVNGGGRIIGVGNGDPISHEADKASKRRAFNGYCLLILQAGTEVGALELRAHSTGLLDGHAIISVG
ncbi:beta-galactosidase GalA [Paenibacillus sp. BC26]|uniref:beta-galactosidase GalA n=1 Tax=Paenibacillus sp. BC26 TaxID=1881032 RepID=UPI0008DF0F09|nr:beta-galactosidase GalA [Paenibacillus sp. BC26]SFT19347.1 beta-galactosidase [Paenibacillus sp. BC26]